MPPLEVNEEVKLEPEETIGARVKLNPRKRINTRAGLKVLIPKKLLTRLTALLVKKKQEIIQTS